jgi:hypothetical protein
MGTEAFPSGVKRQWREAHYSTPSSAEVKKNLDLYIHAPIHLHGIVPNIFYEESYMTNFMLVFYFVWKYFSLFL